MEVNGEFCSLQDFGLEFFAKAKPLRPRPKSQGQGQPIARPRPRPQYLALGPRPRLTSLITKLCTGKVIASLIVGL